jgi:hypothetical protein
MQRVADAEKKCTNISRQEVYANSGILSVNFYGMVYEHSFASFIDKPNCSYRPRQIAFDF